MDCPVFAESPFCSWGAEASGEAVFQGRRGFRFLRVYRIAGTSLVGYELGIMAINDSHTGCNLSPDYSESCANPSNVQTQSDYRDNAGEWRQDTLNDWKHDCPRTEPASRRKWTKPTGSGENPASYLESCREFGGKQSEFRGSVTLINPVYQRHNILRVPLQPVRNSRGRYFSQRVRRIS